MTSKSFTGVEVRCALAMAREAADRTDVDLNLVVSSTPCLHFDDEAVMVEAWIRLPRAAVADRAASNPPPAEVVRVAPIRENNSG